MLLRFLCLGILLPYAMASQSNQAIFAAGEDGIYEVSVIQEDTDNESSHGSGFLALRGDLLITNYHVIEPVLHKPEHYRLELVSPSGERFPAQLLDIDVIHDLAVLRTPKPLGAPFQLAAPPPKGSRLFSMGNPLDLGLTLSESTNNGPLEDNDSERLLLSGTLNPGMSGGPTFNQQQQVVGINVAIAGDELSLVIPATHAQTLLERVQARAFEPETAFEQLINTQTVEHIDRRNQRILDQGFSTTEFVKLNVPDEIDYTVRCWDSSREHETGDRFRYIGLSCRNGYGIYISEQQEFGSIDFSYRSIQAKEADRWNFIRNYQKSYRANLHNDSNEQSHTDYACTTRFMRIGERPFKSSLCRRDYRKYPGLSDLLFTAALVDEPKSGLIISLTMVGVPYDSSIKVVEKLVGEIQWKP